MLSSLAKNSERRIADVHIKPDHGSHNPLLPRARRTVRKRSYTVYVRNQVMPRRRARNTIYAANGALNNGLTGPTPVWPPVSSARELQAGDPDRKAGTERRTLGPFYPQGRYFSGPGDFDRWVAARGGCRHLRWTRG